VSRTQNNQLQTHGLDKYKHTQADVILPDEQG